MSRAIDRRLFLQVAGAGGIAAAGSAPAAAAEEALRARFGGAAAASRGEPVCRFEDEGRRWAVHEERGEVEAPLVFVAADGATITLAKRLEPTFAPDGPSYLGLAPDAIGLADADLLADRLLAHGGDPDPEAVRRAAPPLASGIAKQDWGARLPWTTFIGTRAAGDTMPVFPTAAPAATGPSTTSPSSPATR